MGSVPSGGKWGVSERSTKNTSFKVRYKNGSVTHLEETRLEGGLVQLAALNQSISPTVANVGGDQSGGALHQPIEDDVDGSPRHLHAFEILHRLPHRGGERRVCKREVFDVLLRTNQRNVNLANV